MVEQQFGSAGGTGTLSASDVAAQTTSFTCQNCGATTNFTATRSIRCPFCASEYVLDRPDDPNVPQPEALIPFEFEESRAQESYTTWLGSGFFRARDIREKGTEHKMQAMFLPFWECAAEAYSEWSAEAGHTRYRTENYTARENGKSIQKTRQVPYTEWRRANGRHQGSYTRELVSGSRGLPQEWISRLGDYDWGRMQTFNPQFLMGRESEESMHDHAAALSAGRRLIEDRERDACAALVPGNTQRNLRVSTDISDLRTRLIFLPVWMASFRYNDKLYRCVVNGQTGQVGGDAPLAKGRVAMVAGAVVVVIAVIILLIILFS